MKQTVIKGRWAVVTGASGGIGLEFCKDLASRGCNLLMIAIEDELLASRAAQIREDYGVQTLALTIDLTARDAVTRIVAFLETRGIEPYILVNNAGIFTFSPITEHSREKIDRFIDLHVGATTQLCREIGARMKERGEGRMLNMSSMSCWMPMPGIAMYSATKAYIRVFSRALHYELKDFGVTVTVACPGGIATDLFGLPKGLQKLAVRLGVLALPDRFAHKAVGRMLRGRRQYVNGLLNRLSIFFVGVLPTWARMQVKRRMLDRGIRV